MKFFRPVRLVARDFTAWMPVARKWLIPARLRLRYSLADMGILLEFSLFTLPFLAYLLWWRLMGRKPGHEPSQRIVMLAAIGVVCAVAGAAYYGLSRSFERGEKYVPARIEGGVILRGEGVAR